MYLDLEEAMHMCTLSYHNGGLEESSRVPEFEGSEEVHALVLCLLQEGVDPAVVALEKSQGLEVTGHRTYHA